MPLFTYSDAVEHAIDFLGGTPDALAQRDSRRAVQAAYRELVKARTWSYLTAHGRIYTNPPYTTGTVAYRGTGGLYSNAMIIYGGMWPTWAGPGCKVRIGTVTYDVQERKTTQVISLVPTLAPSTNVDYSASAITTTFLHATPIVIGSLRHGLETGDVVIIDDIYDVTTQMLIPTVNAAWIVTVINDDNFSLDGSDGSPLSAYTWDSDRGGSWRRPPTTPFTLYQDDYLLPLDFVKSDTAMLEGNFGGLEYTDFTDQLWFQRFFYSAGAPRFYCIKGSQQFIGRLAIGFFPFPDIVRSIDYAYERKPRNLFLEAHSEGTVTTDGTDLVTGSGTDFSPIMAGSVLRLGTRDKVPSSYIGNNPPSQGATIVQVISSIQVRVSTPMYAATDIQFVISDPVDIEYQSMLTAFTRGIEKQIAIVRHLQDLAGITALYDTTLREAMAADSRSYQMRVMGQGRRRWNNPKYMSADFFPATS